jgi:hypothetical protein
MAASAAANAASAAAGVPLLPTLPAIGAPAAAAGGAPAAAAGGDLMPFGGLMPNFANLTQEQLMAQMSQFFASQGMSIPTLPSLPNLPMVNPPTTGGAAAAGGAAGATPRKKTQKKDNLLPSSGLNFSSQIAVQLFPPKHLKPGDSLLVSLTGDLQLAVFNFLDGPDLVLLSRTSKFLHTVTGQPRVWKEVCMRLCQYPCVHHSHPWKELYSTRMAKLADKNRPPAERQFKKKHNFVCTHCECTKGFETQPMLTNHIELRHGPNRQRPPIPQARPAKVSSTHMHIHPYTVLVAL